MAMLTDVLKSDHRRLDGLLAECKSLAAGRSFSTAAARFAEFARGLSWHIDAEEDVLFPVLERHAPGATGPTDVMRAEHEQIRDLLARIASALDASDSAWHPAVSELENLLAGHNRKEEHVLYPMANQVGDELPDCDEVRGRIVQVLAGKCG
jgi:hemerythrin-like domain-containing protein